MDLLFNKATRQIGSLRADLTRYAAPEPADNLTSLQGGISASLTMAGKTLNDLEEMVKREMAPDRRAQFRDRLKQLKADQEAIKEQFHAAKTAHRARDQLASRAALLTPAASTPSSTGTYGSQAQLTEALLGEREGRTLDYTGTKLDEYISIGMSTLEGLRNQRTTLKSTQRKVLDAATSLGLSKSVIRVIERKSAQDRVIFWAGVAATLLVLYLVWKYVRP